MKIFHSLDFKSQLARIEPNMPDEYKVHTEDYEDINTLVRRAVQTKTKFKPENVSGAEYDEDTLDKVAQEFNKLPEESSGDASSISETKQSEVKEQEEAEQELFPAP